VTTDRHYVPTIYGIVGRNHWHVVPTVGGASIEEDHDAWHETGAPCLHCDAVRWTAPGHHLTSSGLPLRPCIGREAPSTTTERSTT